MKALEKLLETIDNRIAFFKFQDYLSDRAQANMDRWVLARQLVETAEGPENIQFLIHAAADRIATSKTKDEADMWTEFLELVRVTDNMAAKEVE